MLAAQLGARWFTLNGFGKRQPFDLDDPLALGFQLNVFDNPPGTDGYTPLRRGHVVTWVDATKTRELKTAADIVTAEKAGELKITPTIQFHPLG